MISYWDIVGVFLSRIIFTWDKEKIDIQIQFPPQQQQLQNLFPLFYSRQVFSQNYLTDDILIKR